VAVETLTPESCSKASQCSASVRSGLFSSWSGNHRSSSAPFLAGGPGLGLSSPSPLSLRRLSQRLMEGSDTPKIRATSPRGIPRSTASNTLSLRSFEYAFMPVASTRINFYATRCKSKTWTALTASSRSEEEARNDP